MLILVAWHITRDMGSAHPGWMAPHEGHEEGPYMFPTCVLWDREGGFNLSKEPKRGNDHKQRVRKVTAVPDYQGSCVISLP